MKRRVIPVDRATGEIMSDDYYVRNRKQDEAYRKALEKERYIATNVGRHWVAGYHAPIKRESSGLELREAGAVMKLITYLRFNSGGKLIYKGNPMTRADMCRIFKRGKTATDNIISALEDRGILLVNRDSRPITFRLSDEFHAMGVVREGERFTKIYQARTREITDNLSLEDAGVLYKIIPYFHYERLYLCANPDEPDPDKVKILSRKELAEIIGFSPESLSRAIARLRRQGALMSTLSGRQSLFYVHPDLMFRQAVDNDYADTIRKMFEDLLR